MTGIIFTIAQQKGGAGKTTVAAHLAVAWSRPGQRSVAILDIDPQGSLGEWLEMRERRLGEDATGLTFRTASSWGARREAQRLARDHDVVLIDTPANAEREARPAMEIADLLIVPVQPTPMDLWATRPTLDMAARARVPALLVLNRVPARARLTESVLGAMRELNADIAVARLGNRVAFAESVGDGATVLEKGRYKVAAAEVRALAHEIMDRAGAAASSPSPRAGEGVLARAETRVQNGISSSKSPPPPLGASAGAGAS